CASGMGQEIRYDEIGNVVGGSFMDFFLPTAVETPKWETDYTVTPSPHHPIGAKGVGESPNVGGVPAFSNAVNDAFSFLGTTHIQMPHDHRRSGAVAQRLGLPRGPERGARRRGRRRAERGRACRCRRLERRAGARSQSRRAGVGIGTVGWR